MSRGFAFCLATHETGKTYTIMPMKKRISTPAKPVATRKSLAETDPARVVSEVSPITLTVDIGGTGLKMMALDPSGKPITDRLRTLTPKNPTPERLIAALEEMREQMP